jgi:hypothetical protein
MLYLMPACSILKREYHSGSCFAAHLILIDPDYTETWNCRMHLSGCISPDTREITEHSKPGSEHNKAHDQFYS